jgi:hypothetical protein
LPGKVMLVDETLVAAILGAAHAGSGGHPTPISVKWPLRLTGQPGGHPRKTT